MLENTATMIWIKTSFEGIHHWPNAPEGSILRHPHRHIFHVKVGKAVEHNDRDIEFIGFKQVVTAFCETEFGVNRPAQKDPCTTLSCEQMAEILYTKFNAKIVEVSEDDENGATVVQVKGFDKPKKHPIVFFDPSGSLPQFEEGPIPQETDRIARVGSGEAKDIGIKFGTPNGDQLKALFAKASLVIDAEGRVLKQTAETLPSMQIKTRCFIGTEAEGPYRGQFVLFVPGCVSPAELDKARKHLKDTKHPLIQRIYLGAGNLPYPRNDTIRLAIDMIGASRIDVEVDSYSRIEETAHHWPFTVISRDPEEKAKVDFIKQIGIDAVTWVRNSLPKRGEYEIYRTMLNDLLYSQDIDLNY